MVVGFLILGCDKNTVDAEYLAGLLCEVGHETVALESTGLDRAYDAIVVITCGFVGDAKQQSVEAIVALAEAKKLRGNPRRLYVAGCLSQRYAEDLLGAIPEVDGIAGVGRPADLARMIQGTDVGAIAPPDMRVDAPVARRRLDAKPYSFLKIADGCNHACAFCAIPAMKGPLRSVPREVVLDEARRLLDGGAKELNLVAQDTSVYGEDLGGAGLPGLLRDLAALDGDFWIRCLYVYPGGISEELIDVLASEPKVLPYLDIPFQHFDRDVLREMRRPSSSLDAAELTARLRERVQGITLRTTLLVGFPGESPHAHRRLLDAMEKIRFERLGAFQFSPEEGTAAAEMPRQVGKRTKAKRWAEVMQSQAGISEQWNQSRVGSEIRTLVETYDAERRVHLARSAAEAPEVDGLVLIEGENDIGPGDFVTVEITGADVYDVRGRVVKD